jgi:VCBS repeat-containing protein
MSGDNIGSTPGAAAAPVLTSGSFSIDGHGESVTLQIGGQPVPLSAQSVGASFTGDHGVLTITGIGTSAGVTTVQYGYALHDNRLGAGGDAFTLTVTDATADTSTTALHIDIVDDAPVARDDLTSLLGPVGTQATGNVITGQGTTSGLAGADRLGADHAEVVGVVWGLGVPTADPAGGLTVVGVHGTLTLSANGAFSYAVTNGTAPDGSTEVFTYLLRDQDGSTASATLTVTLGASGAGLWGVSETLLPLSAHDLLPESGSLGAMLPPTVTPAGDVASAAPVAADAQAWVLALDGVRPDPLKPTAGQHLD